MKLKNPIYLAALALALAACIPSVKPFYTASDVVFEEKLLGTWTPKDADKKDESWTFARAGTNDYALTVLEAKGKKGLFKATLFKLKGQQFLDIIPSKCDFTENQAELVSCSIFPGHLLVRLNLATELELAFFDFDKLEKMLKEKPGQLAHHIEEDRIVLTADTAALQAFVLKNMEQGLFGDKAGFTRKSQ